VQDGKAPMERMKNSLYYAKNAVKKIAVAQSHKAYKYTKSIQSANSNDK
jgi:hypothetical protein